MGKTLDTLGRIKRLVSADKIVFSIKAQIELERDRINPQLVKEAILNAPVINKRLRSRDPITGRRENLFVIVGSSYDGLVIYTKGKIRTQEHEESYYILISSKRAVG